MIYTVSTFHDDSPYLNCELAMERVLVMTHGVQQRCSRCRLRPCWQSTEDDTNGAFHLFILTLRCRQKAEPARLCSAGQRAQLRSRSLLSGVKSLSRTSSRQVLFFPLSFCRSVYKFVHASMHKKSKLFFHEGTFLQAKLQPALRVADYGRGSYAAAVRKNAACPRAGGESANGESYFFLSFLQHRRATAQLGREANTASTGACKIYEKKERNWSERMNDKNI